LILKIVLFYSVINKIESVDIKMKKIILMFVSLFVFSEAGLGLQRVLKVGREGSQRVLRHSHYSPQKRFFSSSYPSDPIHTVERSKNMQVFSRPTYDRIAKYVLSQDESVRVDILRAFTGISTLSSAIQLDEHHNPFDPLHNLRKLINSTSSQSLFETIRDSSEIELSINGKKNKQASEILKGISVLYDDLAHAFPNNRYRSTVDFLCETDFGYITIEFQVAKQDYWDKRALAYIASIYGNQLRPKKDYGQIQDVIGVNILGDGSAPYWRDGDFMRDYTFVNQRGLKHKIPSLRLIQYSLGDVDLNHKDLKENDHLRQWIEFFKSAHEKESMPISIDEPVKKAYEMIRVDILKKEHPELLKASDEFFASLTEHDQAVRDKANQDLAKKLLTRKKMDSKEIAELTGLSEVEILKLKN
jgi:predicted transposase/invertase (TIGR01784 family)